MRSFFAEGTAQTADGETLTLVCDFYTIDVVEGITGQNWDDVIPEIGSSKTIAIKVLYGLLRKRHEGITLDQAAALVYDKNSLAIWAVAGDVIRRACNFDEEEQPEEPAKKKQSGRRRSSASNG
jgi:hypothetical protein